MSNGTKTSSLTKHTLQGGWDNTRMVFIHNPQTRTVQIRHHTDLYYLEKYLEKFHIEVDGSDTIIDSNEWYSADFARKVWNIFVNLDQKIARNKWTRVD